MRIQINLDDAMVKKLDELASSLGVTRSAFCAMTLGNAVLSYDKLFDSLKDALIPAVAGRENK